MQQLSTGYIFEGKYRIEGELGRGGFGTVYLAYQMGMERHVALKVLNPDVGAHAARTARERFIREIRIITKLHHPNTITIHDFGETLEGILYMVLEFVEGETLKSVLAKYGPLNELRALKIATQIAKSLSEAHRHNVVHRDLKPANIMLTHYGKEADVVKVLDFGVARLRGGHVEDLTSVGLPPGERELIGTPRYMSPEQVKGEELTGASDVYSLGLMLYEMISGEPAVAGGTTLALITQQVSPEPLRLAHLDHSAHTLAPIIRCATSKAPAARYTTIDEMLEDLEGALVTLKHAHMVQTSGEFSPRGSLHGVVIPGVSTQPSPSGRFAAVGGAGRSDDLMSSQAFGQLYEPTPGASQRLTTPYVGPESGATDPFQRAMAGGGPQAAHQSFGGMPGGMHGAAPGGLGAAGSSASSSSSPSWDHPHTPNPSVSMGLGGGVFTSAPQPTHDAYDAMSMSSLPDAPGWDEPPAAPGFPAYGQAAAPGFPTHHSSPNLAHGGLDEITELPPAFAAPQPGASAVRMDGQQDDDQNNPYAVTGASMSRQQASQAGQRVADAIRPQPEGSATVAFVATAVVVSAAAVCFYLAFIILGAAIAQILTGPLRLGAAIVAAILIPGVALIGEGGKRERFKVKYDNLRRVRNALMVGVGSSIATVIITAGIFPGEVVSELRADPNWFMGLPSSAQGKPETFAERTNRDTSHKVAELLEESLIAAGIYRKPGPNDKPKERRPIKTQLPRERMTIRRAPAPTRPGTRDANDKPEANGTTTGAPETTPKLVPKTTPPRTRTSRPRSALEAMRARRQRKDEQPKADTKPEEKKAPKTTPPPSTRPAGDSKYDTWNP